MAINDVTSIQYFDTKGFLFIPEFLSKEQVKSLHDEMFRLFNSGQTIKDTQCPLSDSVYGAELFDSILEQVLPYFEKLCGKKLKPCYSYARIYRPGEELVKHFDRESGEISATICLGFSGKPWPIHFSNSIEDIEVDTFSLIPGDTILYKGMKKCHWREPLKDSDYQCQLFLHYVDAEGENKDYEFDKRTGLSHHENTEQVFRFLHVFNEEQCKRILEGITNNAFMEQAVIGDKSGTVNLKIRNTKKVELATGSGIGATLSGIALNHNFNHWGFDITHSDQCEALIYDVEGHYTDHIDTFIRRANTTRKLTTLLFLNSDYEGGRFYIKIGNEKLYPSQSAGTVLTFPSFLIHGVEPITKGTRYSIVSWMVGPWFK